jgi:hypothetical protein
LSLICCIARRELPVDAGVEDTATVRLDIPIAAQSVEVPESRLGEDLFWPRSPPIRATLQRDVRPRGALGLRTTLRRLARGRDGCALHFPLCQRVPGPLGLAESKYFGDLASTLLFESLSRPKGILKRQYQLLSYDPNSTLYR